MNWMYGLVKNEKGVATLASFDKDERHGFAFVPKFGGKVLIRETDILFPCGPFNIPTDEIGKDLAIGEVIECMIVETHDGLMGIGGRKVGTRIPVEGTPKQMYGEWKKVNIPRFMGVVKHWNKQKKYGFIESDHLRTSAFFQQRELLVPFSATGDPYSAAAIDAEPGGMVTFDCVETPRGLRGLAVKPWKKDMGEYSYGR